MSECAVSCAGSSVTGAINAVGNALNPSGWGRRRLLSNETSEDKLADDVLALIAEGEGSNANTQDNAADKEKASNTDMDASKVGWSCG